MGNENENGFASHAAKMAVIISVCALFMGLFCLWQITSLEGKIDSNFERLKVQREAIEYLSEHTNDVEDQMQLIIKYGLPERDQNRIELGSDSNSEISPIDSVVNWDTLRNHKEYFAVLGTEDNNVYIIEFADFSCIACKHAHEFLTDMANEYPRSMRYVFRNYTQTEYGKMLAITAECAGRFGEYWDMHNWIYENIESRPFIEEENGKTFFVVEEAARIAGQLGLANTERYAQCIEDEPVKLPDGTVSYSFKVIPEIDEDIAYGDALFIKGTPTFIVAIDMSGVWEVVVIEGYDEEKFKNLKETLITKGFLKG